MGGEKCNEGIASTNNFGKIINWYTFQFCKTFRGVFRTQSNLVDFLAKIVKAGLSPSKKNFVYLFQ